MKIEKKFSGIIFAVVFIAIIIGTAAGCRMVEPPAGPEAEWEPPDWARDEQADDPVWESIKASPADLSRPLTLVDCLDIALKNSPATRQAWAGALSAAAEVGQAESLLYPQLAVNATGTYLKQEYTLKTGAGAADTAPDMDEFNYGPGLELNWLLFDFGGVRGGIEEARQMLLAANYSFNQSIQDMILSVEKSYYQLQSARSEVTAAEADVKDTKKALEAARKKLDVGLVSKLDELQADSSYQDSLYQLESSRGALETARAELAASLGLAADAGFSISETEKELPTDISPEDVSSLIEKGLERRSDIAALRAELRAKEAAVGVASSTFYPSLSLGGSANKLWYSYRDDPELYDDSYMYTAYLGLSWDIFTGFSDLEKKRAAEAEAELTRQNLKEAEITAAADVWNKYYAYQTAVKKYSFSEAFLETARQAYNLALESYNNGLKDIIDLLQAQSDLSSARSQLITSKKDLFVSIAELAHATGTLKLPDKK